MRKIFSIFALTIVLLVSASTMAQVNMSRYITLTVKNGQSINLVFKAAAASTPIRIVSGSNTQNITVDTVWSTSTGYNTDGTTMTVYGDITGLNCYYNYINLIGLDASNNTELMSLSCDNNQLTTLDVSKNTKLTSLSCTYNQISSLDISKNTKLTIFDCNGNNLSNLNISNNTELKELNCSNNQLSGLDISKNTKLTMLNCSNNQFTTLNVSKNTLLTDLSCSSNQLSSLDISKNTKLAMLDCYGNKFTTAAIDSIYCTLPIRQEADSAIIYPVKDSSDPNHATVIASTKKNATEKNWKVKYSDTYKNIPATTGNYVCFATDIDEATTEQALNLYPNPVADVLYLSATARTIRIYNMYGTEVAHATDTDRVEVSHLPAGVYTVKADSSIAKMVKR
ncbi:MAG: T9SS type A sorting domain-containing protein [Bacteroidetes bacterium]|nr:T9SS type A sorting domain-containing protein [Bacteroidota bacterium]